MSAAFTPGPWRLDQTILRGGHILVFASDYGIAKVYDEEVGSQDTNKANARLIAAAPDLYEALDAMMRCAALAKLTLGDMDASRAALAKARGEV